MDFVAANHAWAEAHPEEADKLRQAKIAAENGEQTQQDGQPAPGSVEAQIQQAEGGQPKPGDQPAAAAAATPARIDEWTGKSPELKAAFEKNPALQAEVMEMARGYEAAQKVIDIVATPEEAQFAVEHANRLVTLQANWMLSAEDPQMLAAAWEQTVDMFKERDQNGAEVKGPDGKPVLGADFKPFVRKAASAAIADAVAPVSASIAALTEKLKGNYPSEEARAADAQALEELNYEKAAYDYVLDRLGRPAGAASTLPKLPANATPEQLAFQQQLEAQQAALNAKTGKETTATRREAQARVDRDVQTHFETGINTAIESYVNAMKARGEYLPDFVLTDKHINPQTQQPTKVSDFGARAYLALNAKINGNPLHVAKLRSLQALGAAGAEARKAEVTRLTNLYLPKIIEGRVKDIQDGIRGAGKQAQPAGGPGTVARVEPQSQGTVVPSAMTGAEVRQWAEAEAAKDPSWANMTDTDKERLTIQLAARKRWGG